MKFLCDVHISYKIVNHLNASGFETVHINNILDKWFTKDKVISDYADQNDFIIITKDSDFRDSFFVKKSLKKLIKINLGNIPNNKLCITLSENITLIHKLSSKPSFLIEIQREKITYVNGK